jgi:hypothetical protein
MPEGPPSLASGEGSTGTRKLIGSKTADSDISTTLIDLILREGYLETPQGRMLMGGLQDGLHGCWRGQNDIMQEGHLLKVGRFGHHRASHRLSSARGQSEPRDAQLGMAHAEQVVQTALAL